MQTVWRRIDSWLATHAPQVMESLHSGATDEEIAQAEAFLGVDFPDDLRLSYQIHDGQAEGSYSLFPYLEFLSLQNMVVRSQKWQDGENEDFRCEPENISEGIWNGWWNRYWIPFTTEGNGACQCVDLAPAAGGCVGQVVMIEWQEPGRWLVAPSLRAYLETFADALERGEYRFSENGYGLVDSVDFGLLESND